MSRFTYSPRMMKWLSVWVKHYRPAELARRFNEKFGVSKTPAALKTITLKNGIKSGLPRGIGKGESRLLTRLQQGYVRREIKRHTHAEVAEMLNKKYGLTLTAQQIRTFTKNHRINSGRTGQFQKGITPWNAGKKGLRMSKETEFKKGHVPANLRRIGAERIDCKDGYVLVKISEKNPYTSAKTRFKAKHIVLWEKRNGPVPKNHIVIFKNGNKRDFSRGNLTCVTRAIAVRLNQMGYLKQPEVLRETVFELAKLKTKLGDLRRMA